MTDKKDFEGIFKFKLIAPFFYLASCILMFVGPWLFREFYDNLCTLSLIYIASRSVMMLSYSIYGAVKSFKILKKSIKAEEKQGAEFPSIDNEIKKEFFQGFIVPNYCEDFDLLAETLTVLAGHRCAKQRYLVFLAMEAHEKDSDKKAEALINKFKSEFHLITFTHHVLREGEYKGKGANVNWCLEHLEPIFEDAGIRKEEVLITIMDADSWIPNVYIDEIDEHMMRNEEEKDFSIFSPPQMFTINSMQVPMLSRAWDSIQASLYFSNFPSVFKTVYPVSNYTMSFNMLKNIGFIDTCEDAISEDFHTAFKSFWKTKGQAKVIVIYAMCNQVNI